MYDLQADFNEVLIDILQRVERRLAKRRETMQTGDAFAGVQREMGRRANREPKEGKTE